jgi:hypothetical protein
MAKISRTTPRMSRFVPAVLCSAAGVAVVGAIVFGVDRAARRLIGDGSAGLSGLLAGVLLVVATLVTWRQEPGGSSLSGIFGGQIASPRARRGRGEMTRIWVSGALCLAAVLVSVAGWAS